VPPLGPDDDYKYLGILFGARGRRISYGQIMEDGISQITRAPLKPQQRLVLLVNHLIPRLQHRLVLGKVYRTQLSRLDQRVRVAVRAWLKLPKDVPDAMVYAAVSDGGLGIPHLSTLIQFLKQSRLENMSHSTDPLVRYVATTPAFMGDQRYWGGPVKIKGVLVRHREDCQPQWRRALLNTVDGLGLGPSNVMPKVHKWVSSGTKLLTGTDFCHAVAVRCGALPTPVRASRGRPGINPNCATCHEVGSLGHISQSCPITHGARVKRHDNISHFLAGRLRQRGYTVLEEPRLPHNGSFQKPDLVCWRGNGKAWVIDAQVVADRFPLTEAHRRKVEKYDSVGIRSAVEALTGCASVVCGSATLNWRGSWARESAVTLCELGLTLSDLQVVAVKALTWTHHIWKIWNRKPGRRTVGRQR